MKMAKTVMSSGLSERARQTELHTWAPRDWKVEKGLDSGGRLALAWDLSWESAGSEKEKTLATKCLSGPFGSASSWAFGEDGRSTLTRVDRALVRSWKGGTEMVVDGPRVSSAHEVMKCQVECPSKMAWLKAQPSAKPFLSFVNCSYEKHFERIKLSIAI